MPHVKGTFEVKLTPLALDEKSADSLLSRLLIDKKFHGALDATSKGEMLAAGTTVKGSAGYVAIEKVTGTLAGRTGSLVFQHTGTMNRGEPQLSVTIVPDSGTDQWTGITGKMNIKIEKKQHFYELEYTLPEISK